jgi:hypothetical protein
MKPQMLLLSLVIAMANGSTLAKGGGHGGGKSGGGGHTSSGHVNSSSHSVRGYTKKNGTSVAPSHATNPNKTRKDNYSQKGNVNPHTGKPGQKN